MKKQIFAFGTIAAMTAFAPQLISAEAEVKADVDLPKSTRTEVKTDRDRDIVVKADADRETRDKIRGIDKASGVIGMEVRNRENQKLGEIKDLVLDMNSGRVSYAVLAVGGFLGVGEKLIALPPAALKVANEGQFLLLDADKAKVQAAPGFAATAWPAPNDPEVTRFWNEARSTGSPARSESSRGVDVKGDVDLDDGKADVKVDTDSKKKIYTDADKDAKVKVEVEKD